MIDDTHLARVVAVQEALITMELPQQAPQPLVKNEVVYILPRRQSRGRQERLKAEVLRVQGREAVAQVFESTKGVAVGDPVEQSGQLLSVTLGPGLLGQIYDGLQNPLEDLAVRFGNFLPRGIDLPALSRNTHWSFTPTVATGVRLHGGDVLGSVQEGRFVHKIMVPFDQSGEVVVTWIQQGTFTVDQPIARIRDERGDERVLTLQQDWPVRRALPERMVREGRSERLFPREPLTTSQRLIDTFFPIARGGTGCIPGPFGAGKTVLQGLISRFSAVDIVLVVACGERAGEVVETIREFPKMQDPRTGGSLMERTIIICNTSSMPVAAREASIYTGITLGEYYRQMGYDVLLLADSTSRWAQAMRETSGRMEEIPGDEAFPAYLNSAIRGVYERAGMLRANDGDEGSLTMIGTVSPAGGNFEEPVTQATLGTVKCFLGLSAERAYKRFYPAVDPLLSWSRYHGQLRDWFERSLYPGWTDQVAELNELLLRGDGIEQMTQVTGEEGITLDDFVVYHKAVLVDMVYLQQDAFDAVDSATPLERQSEVFRLLYELVTADYRFDDKDQARDFFTRITGLFRNLNYAKTSMPEYPQYRDQIRALSDRYRAAAVGAPA
jgi:V/A-type H+-transporting ATPase subunit A